MEVKEPNVSVTIPNELIPLLSDLANGQSVDDNVRISLAISLFVAKSISLARASEIAGLSLNNFICLLQSKGIAWGEYIESDYISDAKAVNELLKELGEKNGSVGM